MLLRGPPQIVMLGCPLKERAPLSVGCRIKIGIGDTLVTIAAVAWAATFFVPPPTNPIRVALTGRITVTRRRGTESFEAFEIDTPGSWGKALTWLQKSTYTVSPLAGSKPFSLA